MQRSNTPDSLIKTMPAVQRLQSRFPGCERLLTREELAERGREEVRQLLARRREAAQRRLEVAIGRSGIPPRFQGKSFTDYRATLPGQRHALSVCRSYGKRFLEDGQRSDNLLLLGGPGTGKTHLATAILAEIICAGYKGLFLSAADALQLMRDAYAPTAERSERETMTVLTDPDLLVLDEVGMAIGRDTTRQAQLFHILNERYGCLRATIVIGNLTTTELEGYLGERILDRLCEGASATVSFDWPSYRRLRVINSGKVPR